MIWDSISHLADGSWVRLIFANLFWRSHMEHISIEYKKVLSDIRAFIFDVDGTLYQHKKLRRLIYKKMLNNLFYHPLKGFESVISVLSYRRALEKLRTINFGDTPLKEMQFKIASNISLINENRIKEHVRRWMKCEPLNFLEYVKYPDLDIFLRKAKRNGFKLAVFSDYPVEKKIEYLGYKDIFDIEISSQDSFINKLKPDPTGIEYIVKYLNLKKNEIIYIGDRYDIDTTTAHNAGVKCIIIGEHEELLSDEVICVKSYKQIFWILNSTLDT